jgi:hypothetical protein
MLEEVFPVHKKTLTDFTLKVSRTEKKLYEELLKTEEAEILA